MKKLSAGTLNRVVEQVFHEAHEALEALPLTTAEFATARNRLNNARSYLEAGEPGAALYEFRLLWRSLEH
jgi:hypothetical protein